MRRALAALAASLALASCGSDDSCTVEGANRFVFSATVDWYLYPELLPDPLPDPALYADPQVLLDYLTANARAAGKDRHWSYVASYSAVTGYYAGAPTVGFGFSLQIRGGQLLLAQVMGGSAADYAGFLRGDEILSISEGGAVLAAAPFTDESVANAIGPPAAGVTRTFEVAPVGGGAIEQRDVAKAPYTLDPVPAALVLDRGVGVPPVGYVNLRTFITPAEDQLRDAFALFQASGVEGVIVDLRYNGGGLVDTAVVLANLLGGGLAGETMLSYFVNPSHVLDTPPPVFFLPEADAIAPLRIAFVTTGASASASELVPNSLEPYVDVAIVGARTYGKPVGQAGFVLESCDLLLGLISFGLRNAEGDGEYYDGLPGPGFSGPLCEAADDLSHPMGDQLEASTAAALHFVENGACPPAPAPASSALRSSAPRTSVGASHPTAAEPTPAQRDVAGLF